MSYTFKGVYKFEFLCSLHILLHQILFYRKILLVYVQNGNGVSWMKVLNYIADWFKIRYLGLWEWKC